LIGFHPNAAIKRPGFPIYQASLRGIDLVRQQTIPIWGFGICSMNQIDIELI
jgi:hypothetical protein